MAQISFSNRANDFLRELLISSMRHYALEIEADEALLASCEDDMKEMYESMLSRDKSCLFYAKDLYAKLLDVRYDDLDYFQNFCDD